MSCTGKTECPLPNICTRPPPPMHSAIIAATFSMVAVCVVQTRSRTSVMRSRKRETLTIIPPRNNWISDSPVLCTSEVDSINSHALCRNFRLQIQIGSGCRDFLARCDFPNVRSRFLQHPRKLHRCRFVRVIEEEYPPTLGRIHLPKL